MPKPYSSSFSIPGDKNRRNADSIDLNWINPNSFTIALADGVGKNVDGPEAARTATRIAVSAKQTEDIQEIFKNAQNAMLAGAHANPGAIWSTTLTICRVSGIRASVGHVGDSRLYHLRKNGIITRTRDQTELQTLIDEGVISKERAKKYPRRNVLLSALSSESTYDLQLSEFEVEAGDRLLLLSDGVYKQILRREIVSISVNSESANDFVEKLKDLLLSRGLIDDSSAICIEIE
jgi:serine/threonine protein phosphatase PrpC